MEEDRPDPTTLAVQPDVRDRLKGMKPYKSMSYNDLLVDMADVYERHDTASIQRRGERA